MKLASEQPAFSRTQRYINSTLLVSSTLLARGKEEEKQISKRAQPCANTKPMIVAPCSPSWNPLADLGVDIPSTANDFQHMIKGKFVFFFSFPLFWSMRGIVISFSRVEGSWLGFSSFLSDDPCTLFLDVQ